MLVLAIENLNNFFNVTRPMSDVQTAETINLMCQRFPSWRMDDFKLCFDRMKMGYYGKTYNRIDGQTIFEGLNDYDNDRMNEAEILNTNKHEAIKKGLHDTSEPNKEGQKKVVEILKTAIEGMDVSKQNENKKVGRFSSEIDIFAQKALRQFDFIHKTHRDRGGQKFVKRSGKVMTASEFIDYKIAQYNKLRNLKKI